jgi:hypothetical protein
MADMFQTYKDTHTAAREAFGRMLRLWRERNGWTQYTVERWGREAGFATVSSGNVSMVEQGKAGDLRAQAHFQLADVNRRLADHDWGPLHSPDLRQAVEGAEPITGDDGQLWGPADFWCCYVGLLPVPEAYSQVPSEPVPAIDDALAADLSARWRQQVSAEATRRGLDPIETFQGAARQAPAAQRKTLRAVLAGFRDYRAEELIPLWEGEWLPQQWIEAWLASLPLAVGLEGASGAGDNEDESADVCEKKAPARREAAPAGKAAVSGGSSTATSGPGRKSMASISGGKGMSPGAGGTSATTIGSGGTSMSPGSAQRAKVSGTGAPISPGQAAGREGTRSQSAPGQTPALRQASGPPRPARRRRKAPV